MRYIYGATIIVATLLIVVVTVSSGSHVNAGSGNSAIYSDGASNMAVSVAQVLSGTRQGTTKLPPSPDSVKPVPADPNYQPQTCTAPATNVSRMDGNQAESFVVINPTNPNNIVVFSNITGATSIFRAYSMDSGSTWITGTVATGVACCDSQAVFDTFGNLFLVYISNERTAINLILSTNGGMDFSGLTTIGTGGRGFIDQPSIAVGNGSV